MPTSPRRRFDSLAHRLLAGSLVSVLLGGGVAAEAGNEEVAVNSNLITINDNGDATPFPSTADMSALPSTVFVTRVRVVIRGFSHTFPPDVDILLRAPTGETVMLMSDAGGGLGVSDVDLSFDDCAPALLPRSGKIVSGTYRPGNFGASLDPGFVPQSGSNLLSFVGQPASSYSGGTWSLYVRDDQSPSFGTIAAGWTVILYFSPTQPSAPACGPDFDLDGVPDVIVGAGPGGGPHVQVLSGATGAPLQSFFAYDPSFTGGVHVAACAVNGDGIPDIVTGAGAGGGAHVRVFNGATGTPLAGPLGVGFLAYVPTFTGGVWVGCADMNSDGVPDIIVGAGPGGGPHVRVFDGRAGTPLAGLLGTGLFPYPPGFTGGVFVGP